MWSYAWAISRCSSATLDLRGLTREVEAVAGVALVGADFASPRGQAQDFGVARQYPFRRRRGVSTGVTARSRSPRTLDWERTGMPERPRRAAGILRV